MGKSCCEIVKPSDKGRETSYVFLAGMVVLITCAILISINRKKINSEELKNFQISAFKDLNEHELAIFNGLYTSAVEIDEIHNEGDGEWLTVRELREQLLPPFVRDAAWKKNGQYVWKKTLNPKGSIDVAVYSGNPVENKKLGSFVLLFLHDHAEPQNSPQSISKHAPFEIWYHSSPTKNAPEIITDQAFIASGWKEVEALRGKDEVKRIKG